MFENNLETRTTYKSYRRGEEFELHDMSYETRDFTYFQQAHESTELALHQLPLFLLFVSVCK